MLGSAVLGCTLVLGCGKKGPPLVPIVHVAEPIHRIEARRVGSDVYITIDVPMQNVDGSKPPDVRRIDVFAVSASVPPLSDRFLRVATRVASVPVAPPPRPDAADPAPATSAGPLPGSTITIRETLTADHLIPKPIPAEDDARAQTRSGDAKPSATTAGPTPDATPTPAGGPVRYYMAFAFSNRQRMSAPGNVANVSLTALPDAPSNVAVTYDVESIRVSWAQSGDASGYNVYRDERAEGAPAGQEQPEWSATIPAPVNQAPVTELTYTGAVEFGSRRCYRVRAVRSADGAAVESESSEPACVTPLDTFEPAAPTELTAVTSDGGIDLRWAPNPEKDRVAGYLILRGRPGDATLLPITDAPVRQTQFLDRNVAPGVSYVYAVVAVDGATPSPNRSPESERDEATAPP